MPVFIPTGGTIAEAQTSVTLPATAASEAATATRQGGRSVCGFAMRSASEPARLLPVSVSMTRVGSGDVVVGETVSFDVTVTNPGGIPCPVTLTLGVDAVSEGG